MLLDLDGTVYHEDHALPGAVELIRRLQAEGRTYACLTNSTSSPERLAARLRRMGVEVDPAHIYTAAAATADYVLQHFGGAAAKRRPARTAARACSTSPPRACRRCSTGRCGGCSARRGRRPPDPCDAVICGVPLNVFATDERQRAAMLLLRQGAALVGICADRVYPSPRGLEFGVGAMAAMLAYAADVTPVFCGKPEKIFFHELCRRLGVPPARCVLIGDNLESDIAGGKGVGMRTILALSGVSRREDAERLPPGRRPDAVIGDLREVLR